MWNWLKGKKTYILAGAGVAYAAGGYFTGHMDANIAIQTAGMALGGASLRHGLSTTMLGAVRELLEIANQPDQPAQQAQKGNVSNVSGAQVH